VLVSVPCYIHAGRLQNALLAEWFQNRRDKNQHTSDHPDFDPRTLYIPEQEYRKMTPAQEQYWKIKADNMDIVLFFKMGKFYEVRFSAE
jgi:DNA mismatch repair protein MSH6